MHGARRRVARGADPGAVGEAMIPRDFQSKALANVEAAFLSGAMAALLVSPTGSGKTCMGAMFVAAVLALGKRVAWGAHREELLLQAARTLRSFGIDCGMRGVSPTASVQLGSYQEWAARGDAPDVDYFVPDEAHHMGDRVGWQRIPSAYKAAGKRILGLTATPARGDGRSLPDFDKLVVAAQIRDLQAMGLLVPLVWRGPDARMLRNKVAEEPWIAYRQETPGRCAVVFAGNRVSANKYVDGFRADGWTCELVMGDMNPTERADYLQRHETGEIQVLVNVNVLGEGWDNPRCSCVIVPRGCESPVSWIQWTGRGLRPWCTCGKSDRGEVCSCAKQDCYLLDLAGVAHTLGRPDAPATYSLDGTGIVLASDACPAGERLCKVCHYPLGDMLVCPDCGKDHTPKVPKAIGAPLTDWDQRWDAAKSAVKPSATVMALAGVLRKADEARKTGKPWNDKAPANRFRAIFKRYPTAAEYNSARNLLRAAETFEPEQRRLDS